MRRVRTAKPQKPPAPAPNQRANPASVVDQLVREGDMVAPVSSLSLAKRGVDCGLALLMAVVAVPVVLVSMLIVRLTSRGPALYTQERVGLGGHEFTIYKIRTMIHDCESLTGPKWSVPGDPRVTAFGRVLRALHIDELPQLVNILVGDMSLVGPRPERPVFVNKLSRQIPHYRARLSVLPGITGIAQLLQPPDVEISDVERKLAFDLYYAQTMSLWLDAKILACTALKLLGASRRRIGSLLGMGDAAADGAVTLAFPAESRRSRAA
jgi:lipopolysaccharide/colanic/teichoic acid biosynthesis glycosyltransferase